MFKKMLVVSVFALCSFAAGAANTVIETGNLTEAQVAQIKSMAAKTAAENLAQTQQTVSKVDVLSVDGMKLASAWGTQAAAAAEGFAKAIGIAARELGVTVNEFLKTDAGKLAALIIVWKMIGASLVKLVMGLLIFIGGATLMRQMWNRLFTQEFQTVEYSNFGGFFKGTKIIRVPKSFSGLRNDGEWLALWMIVAIGIGTLIATMLALT